MLPRLLQLASPSLPVGAYAHSEGLEYAVQVGWICDEASAERWISGLLHATIGRLDIPMFGRLLNAWHTEADACEEATTLSAWLLANRETLELRTADHGMGCALARVLESLGVHEAAAWRHNHATTYAAMLALGCARFHISPQDGATALAWSWAENQVTAAIKLVPLGQSAGQRLLFKLGDDLPSICAEGLARDPETIGGAAYGLAIASSRHETQHTRLFRS